MQMALPMVLSYYMPGIGSMIGTSAISNPMMRSAAEQAMLGYGTAALSGSKHPEKAAMYAGLGSMPFSYMKANTAANSFNEGIKEQYTNPELFQTKQFEKIVNPAKKSYWETMGPGGSSTQRLYHPAQEAVKKQWWGTPEGGGTFQNQIASLQKDPITAWDMLGNSEEYQKRIPKMVPEMRNMNRNPLADENNPMTNWDFYSGNPKAPKSSYVSPESVFEGPGDVDFYSKVGTGEKGLMGGVMKEGKSYPDYLPTMAAQTAGLYGGRMTDEEKWEATKARRRKELAFMYGIDESQMKGEMQNPYYGGGGFWADGGLASINYENGGPVSGPGGPKDDLIDARLSDGEFVMTAAAVENLGGGNRMDGAKKMYQMMNQLDPESETAQESMTEVS